MRRVAKLIHCVAGLACQFGRGPRLDFVRKQIGHQRFQRRIVRLEDDEAVAAEQVIHPAGERRADARTGLVTPAKRGQDVGCEFTRRE
jgi:hypothetical protein